MSTLPKPYYDRDGITIYVGDNRDVLPHIEPVHAVVTDPPYDLTQRAKTTYKSAFPGRYKDHKPGGGFMGMKWDATGIAFDPVFWEAVEAAMLPGAHLLAFGGTRTYHRMAVAIEDAGLEIRDTLQWLYGSGFPKSHDVSKAIDKMAGAERETWEVPRNGGPGGKTDHIGQISAERKSGIGLASAPATPAAEQWQGWGTALKPAYEPIIMARAPFKGTVAANVLAHGTGAINVDACRIGYQSDADKEKALAGDAFKRKDFSDKGAWARPWMHDEEKVAAMNAASKERAQAGRWPANVILDEAAADLLDAQSGVSRSSTAGVKPRSGETNIYGGNALLSSKTKHSGTMEYGDTGGASRYFKVVAQDCLSTYNVEEQERAPCGEESTEAGNTFAGKNTESSEGNSHTAGCGSKPTGLFQTDTKSTTSTTTHSITSCPTCNSSPQNGTTTTTSGCGKITETLTALNTDAANGVTSTSHSPSSSGVRQEPIRGTASHASANTSESGEPQTANTTTPTCANTESAITGSRFVYIPKASRRERNAGLEGMPEVERQTQGRDVVRTIDRRDGKGPVPVNAQIRPAANHHPTVKPLALMRYLIQMVTPPGGIILDPFMGSGSTLVAAAELGFHAIGIELSEEYAEIAARRVDHALNERAGYLPGMEIVS